MTKSDMKRGKTSPVRKTLIFVLVIMITMLLCCCGIDTSTVAGSASQVVNNEDYDDSDTYFDNYEAEDNDLEEESNEQMVWVSRTGKCYHCKSSCSNMKDPWQIPLSKAQKTKRPCKKCY